MSNKIWTRNYDNLFSSVFGTFGSTGTTTAPSYSKPWLRDRNGTWRGLDNCCYADGSNAVVLGLNAVQWVYGDYTSSYLSQACMGVEVGTGNGTVSADDYQLFLPATKTDFKIGTVSQSWKYNEDEHSYTKTIKIPVAYSGANAITITEFGVYGILSSGYSGNYPKGEAYMLYHEFLNSPVTLEQNDTLELTLEQTIVQPNWRAYE